MLFDGLSEPRRTGEQGSLNYFVERPYQADAREAVQNIFADEGAPSSVLIELATGLGKTEIFTQIMKEWEDGRCLVIAPYITLISQAAKKIYIRTGVEPAIEQAHNWSVETPWGRSDFIGASKDTLISGTPKRYKRLRDVGLVIVDEAHLSITKAWEELINHYRDQGAKVLGVTATARRHDKQSMKNIYEKCAFQYGITSAVPDGWLVPAMTDCIQLESLDLSDVGTTGTAYGRDFNQVQLNRLLENSETIFEIADITARETAKKKTVVYCSSVEEARLVAERLVDSYGIKADWIASDVSKCTPQHRREALRSFQEDSEGLTHICNVGILTTGWDFPGLECIVMAKPTRSRTLYTQIFGRGTRPLPGVVDFDGSSPETRKAAIATSRKPHFKMIDLVDASLAHKIITCVDVMAGTLGIEEIERAKKNILEADQAGGIDEALLEAAKEIKIEREARERSERARIEARAKYTKRRIDAHAPLAEAGVRTKRRGARMLFGRYRGMLVEDVPTWYLNSCLSGKPFIAHNWLRSAITREVNKRKDMAGL